MPQTSSQIATPKNRKWVAIERGIPISSQNQNVVFPAEQEDKQIPFYQHLIICGDSMSAKGEKELTLFFYMSTLPYYHLAEPDNLSLLYNKIANTYHDLKNEKEALHYYNRADRYVHRAKDPNKLRAMIYSNIGAIFVESKNQAKAQHYLDQALSYFQQHKDTINWAITRARYSRLWSLQEQHKSALSEYKQASALISPLLQSVQENIKPALLFSQINTNIALIYIHLGNPDSARTYLNHALTYGDLMGPAGQPNLYLVAGSIFQQKKRYKEAEAYLFKALHMATLANNPKNRLQIHRALANLYTQSKHYEKALQHAAYHSNLQYEIHEKTKLEINKLNNLEAQYQLSKKDNALMANQLKLAMQEKNIARKNLILVTLSLGGIILLTFVLVFFRTYRRKQRFLQKEAEITALKNMMDREEKERGRLSRELHDGIGGMLAAVRLKVEAIQHAVATESSIDHQLMDVMDLLKDTSAEIRTTAHNLLPETLSRYTLTEALLQYVGKINTNPEIRIDLHLPKPIPTLDKTVELIIFRMVQELIHNAIKHAAAQLIEIQLVQHNGELSLTVEDNGCGFDTSQPGGYGLENLRFRVQSLQGTLDMHSIPGKSTTIRISFSLEKLILAAHS